MGEYRHVSLGELASSEPGSIAIGPFGSRMKAEVYVDTGVPVIRGTNISDGRGLIGEWVYVTEEFAQRIPNCLLRSGDLVFPHRGSIGEVALVDSSTGPMMLSTSMMKFRPDTAVADSGFIYYFFRSPVGRQEILRFSSQVGTPGIGQPLSSLRQFRVPLPDIGIQRSISQALSALDDKIDLNRRMNETLEAMARALFKDWFVDFGPTRAKQAGMEPYLAPELWSLFPERLDAEGKPEGWLIGTLQDIIELNPREPLRKGAVAPYLDMAALPTVGPISDPPFSRSFTSGMRFRNGDTLLARITPCLENGKTAFIQELPAKSVGWGSTEFIVLRSKPPIPPALSYLLARYPAFRAHAIQSMTGTSGRQRARTEALATYPVVIPKDDLWSALATYLEPVFHRIKENGEENHTLAQTRDLLLPKLMSGEIRIEDAEATIEAIR